MGGATLLGSSCTSPEKTPVVGKAPAILSQQTYNWKMITTWPPNFPVLGEGCKLMADWVREMSGGRLNIEVYGGGELVPALEVFDVVSLGAAEMGNGVAYYWAGKVPAAQFFATVPFGMNAQQMNSWLLSGGGLALWQDLYADFNLLPLPSGNTGVQMGGWFNREVNSLTDIQGLKMRIPGLGGKVFTQAGGTAMNVAGGEIFTNLERGVIDATEWIGPYHDYIMGFHKVAKYYYYPGWHEPGSTLETIINRQKFEELPADLQQILITASQRQNIWTLSEFEGKNQIYLDKMKSEVDLQMRAFPPEVLRALKKTTKEVLDDIAANDPAAQKIYASYQAFRKNATAWSQLTEQAYYEYLS
ncbi:MAG: TRAP transporter substrate-binding protein [Bacteroidota bacterium]